MFNSNPDRPRTGRVSREAFVNMTQVKGFYCDQKNIHNAKYIIHSFIIYYLYDLEVDEEKKVEAVRDFYAQAAKNETAFSSAERMLFFGKLSFPNLRF